MDISEDIYALRISQVESRLKSAHSAYKAAKKDASNWRNDFVYELAEARASRQNTSVEAEVKKLQHREIQRRQARNVRRMRNKLERPPTVMCHVTVDGVRREVTEKEDMEQVAATENESRFSQSEHTPLLQEPWLLSYLYNNLETQNIGKI